MIGYSLGEIALMIAAAIVVDWTVGDPRRPVHPVIRIGSAISWLEGCLYREADPPAVKRRKGLLLAIAVPAAAGIAMAALVAAAQWLHPWLGYGVTIWYISTTIAVKGLKDAAMLVYQALREGRMSEARDCTGRIVGRDTAAMDEPEAARATVETVAENTVDALVAPLFWALLGGAPLAMLYRAVNTLDSMVGYRNDRYIDYGKASARLDDAMNYVPARLTGWLLLAAGLMIPSASPRRGRRAVREHASRHPSPNSGIPEAAVAGMLGIELGGRNVYFGVPSERARLGWPLRPLEAEDIRRTVRLLYIVSIICGIGGIVLWRVSG
ncbi:cobalamin biosynthesis protein [Paenibacillus sp. 598K]|uniref:adenosylcobinamide-phosphate synthase CbiB n=1 Tax=Paenibacillus sp. 598K TaxID=1117987 RepID=UPI000FFA1082|nr:adenosylcobinamide-phosphate synthase CbiB [Paenibacillus sp. 598K]GBF78407.1 cobalamin biosynthesis protein [Paenibacillus sp. 598K]